MVMRSGKCGTGAPKSQDTAGSLPGKCVNASSDFGLLKHTRLPCPTWPLLVHRTLRHPSFLKPSHTVHPSIHGQPAMVGSFSASRLHGPGVSRLWSARNACRVFVVVLVGALVLLGGGAINPACAGGVSDTAGEGPGPENLFAAGLTSDFPQKYVFRGLEFDEDWVFQYAAWVALVRMPVVDKLKATGFVNMDQSGAPNEWDLLVEATEDLKVNDVPVRLTAGYGLYKRGDMDLVTDMTTQEVYGILKVSTILNPTVTYVRDIDMIEGTYTELSIDHSLLGNLYGVRFSAKVAYSDDYYRREKGLSHREFGVEVPVFANRQVTVTPYARAINPWDLNADISNHFVSGIRIEMVF